MKVWGNLFETCGNTKSSDVQIVIQRVCGSNAPFVSQPLKIMNEGKGKAEEFILNMKLRQGADSSNRNYFRPKRGQQDVFLSKVFGVFDGQRFCCRWVMRLDDSHHLSLVETPHVWNQWISNDGRVPIMYGLTSFTLIHYFLPEELLFKLCDNQSENF